MSRPIPQAGIPVRQGNSRHHSHSVSLGAVNPNHRVTRRKSVTTAAAVNAAVAVAASLKDTNGELAGVPAPSHRRNLSHRKAQEASSLGTTPGLASYFSRSMNNPAPYPNAVRKTSPTSDEGTAVEAGNADGKPVSTKNRNRRASEGSHLVKGDGKRAMAELRCDRCGKGYKHGSCLSKHMCVFFPTPTPHPAVCWCRHHPWSVVRPRWLGAGSPSWSSLPAPLPSHVCGLLGS